MKKITLFIAIFMLAGVIAIAQVGINTDNSAPDPSAMLDVTVAAMPVAVTSLVGLPATLGLS